MRIDSIHIDDFAREEFTAAGPRSVTDISGGDVLIKGENQSGKTLCFNAISYCLLDRTIELQRGHGNSVNIDLDDGMQIYRGESGQEVQYDRETHGPEGGDDKLREHIGSFDILEHQFIHSHLRQLPLERLSPEDRIGLILHATGEGLSEELEDLSGSVDQLEEQLDGVQSEITSLKNQKADRLDQVRQLESQVEKWEELEEIIEEERIEEISDDLQRKPEIEKRIDDLSSKRTNLLINIKELKNEKGRLEQLSKDTKEVIADALEEFVCPVCEGHVGRNQVEDRLKTNKCPFCSSSHEVSDIVESLDVEREVEDGEIEEIEDEIQEIEREREDLQQEIRELKEDNLEIKDVSDHVVSTLSGHDHDIGEVKVRTEEKLEELRDTLTRYEGLVEDLENEIDQAQVRRSDIQKNIETLQGERDEIETESVSAKVSEFQTHWADHYTEISPELNRDLNFNEDGTIVLNSDSGISREYRRRGDLSDAELTLLSISFVLALNDWAIQHDTASLETIVLDEPFVRFDEVIRQDAISYLNKVDKQIFVTTSDTDVEREFNAAQKLELERYTQTRLSEFIND